VGDSGYLAAKAVGTTGRLISTDFAPEMVAAARQRARELSISNVEFRVLDAERMDLETDSIDGASAAGFAAPEVEEMGLRWRFVDQAACWGFLTEAAGVTSPILRALPAEAQAAVRKQVHDAARPFHAGDGYDFPATVLNVVTH